MHMRLLQLFGVTLFLQLLTRGDTSTYSTRHEARRPWQDDILRLGSHNGPPSFKAQQIRNDAYQSLTGLEAMVWAYSKYRIPLTPGLQRAVDSNPALGSNGRKRGSVRGSVPAYSPLSMDYEFVCPVQIGVPPQTLYMNLDTGSADLWVFSNLLPPSAHTIQALYTPAASHTSRLLASHTWGITYGDGSSASGTVYTDRFTIGGVTFGAQAIEAATRVSSSFTSDVYSSGILGLGFASANTVRPTQQRTFMDNVQPRLYLPVFTANLVRGGPGNYNFGYIDRAEFTDRAVSFVDRVVDGPGGLFRHFWAFRPTGYRVGASPPRAPPRSGWTAIADTGTTLLLVPGEIVAEYYARVRGARYDVGWGAVLFPCTSLLPNFGFRLATTVGSDYWGTLPGRYVNYGRVNRSHCYGGVQSSDGIGFSIFGAMVLKAQFVVFDAGNDRIGWANKRLTS